MDTTAVLQACVEAAGTTTWPEAFAGAACALAAAWVLTTLFKNIG